MISVNTTDIFCLVSVPGGVLDPLLSPCHLVRCKGAQTVPPTSGPAFPHLLHLHHAHRDGQGFALIPLLHKAPVSNLGFSFFPWNPGVSLESRRSLLPRTLAGLESSSSSAALLMLGCARSPWKQQEFHFMPPKSGGLL